MKKYVYHKKQHELRSNANAVTGGGAHLPAVPVPGQRKEIIASHAHGSYGNVIQPKKTAPFLVKGKMAGTNFNYEAYETLKDDNLKQYFFDTSKKSYEDCLKNGTRYWNKAQKVLADLKGNDREKTISALDKKRLEYDRKFKENYVTRTPDHPSKQQQHVGTRGLAHDKDTWENYKSTPYSNGVDFTDNSITASHNYAKDDGARIADGKNLENSEYKKRGLPNSEILWQQFKLAARNKVYHENYFKKDTKVANLLKQLTAIKRENVQNPETRRTLLFAQADGQVDFSENETWKPEQEEFKALLGTPNCSGAAHMLTDHALEMGEKNITDISFVSGKEPNLIINFG